MEKSVDHIEAMFRKAEANLDYMSRKLEIEVENMEGVEQKKNPAKLVRKLEEVKAEYANIIKETVAIQEAQKEFVDYFRSEMMSLAQMLEALESKSGQTPEVNDEALKVCNEMSKALGIPPTGLQPGASCSGIEEDLDVEPKSQPLPPSTSGQENDEGKSDEKAESCTAVSAVERRSGSSDFIDVSEEEFLSVSDLIRQRVKLEEVNKVYEQLWQHFKEEGNTKPLTVKDMTKMGMRVTGATGQAKLKVLRALKLCQISRTGDVSVV